jgi:AcrR family transcriptional regulator
MGRPAKTTDSDVLDATYLLAWQHGCDAITIRDLEVALDLRAPSIYRRFHSRDELLAAAIDRYVECVVDVRVRRYLEGTGDPLRGIRRFFLSVVNAAAEPEVPRGCLVATTSQQSSYAIPVIRDAVDRGVVRVEDALCNALQRAEASGHRFASQHRDLAQALLQSFLGVLLLVRCGQDHLKPSVTVMLDALLGPPTPTPG